MIYMNRMLRLKDNTCNAKYLLLLSVVLGIFKFHSVLAAPFSYEFLLPSYSFNSNSSVFGNGALIGLTFDNGGINNKSQLFSWLDVKKISVHAIGGSFILDDLTPIFSKYTTGFPPALLYTDDTGLSGVFSFNADLSQVRLTGIVNETNEMIQLGTQEWGILTLTSPQGQAKFQTDSYNIGDHYRFGSKASLITVPTPPTLWLIGSGLIALLKAKKRRR